jgi:folylpolyglutamate synthase/dihydropteroate synthase
MRVDGAEIGKEDVVRMMERVTAAAPASTMFFELVTALAWPWPGFTLPGVLW